jgi:hypothetical protein
MFVTHEDEQAFIRFMIQHRQEHPGAALPTVLDEAGKVLYRAWIEEFKRAKVSLEDVQLASRRLRKEAAGPASHFPRFLSLAIDARTDRERAAESLARRERIEAERAALAAAAPMLPVPVPKKKPKAEPAPEPRKPPWERRYKICPQETAEIREAVIRWENLTVDEQRERCLEMAAVLPHFDREGQEYTILVYAICRLADELRQPAPQMQKTG